MIDWLIDNDETVKMYTTKKIIWQTFRRQPRRLWKVQNSLPY